MTLRNGYGLSRFFLGKTIFKSVTLQREGVSVDVASEQVQNDGVQDIADKGNNGNGNGNGGGNGSNGEGGGGGNTGS